MSALPPYGVVIRDAVASGDLAQMKEAAKAADKYLREWGNLPVVLETLKIEIAKLEARQADVS